MSRVTRACCLLAVTVLALAGLAAVVLTKAPTASAASAAFVQQVSGHGNGGSLGVTPGTAVTAGNRLVVEVGVWNSAHSTTSAVTDSAGNSYTELTHFAAADGTEMSVWTAPVTAGGGTKPTITAKASATADIGMAAVEYSGVSTAAGTSVLDVQAHATGKTGGAATVSSGATPATTGTGELAIGFYADSGFGDKLTPGSGWTGRVNLAPTSDMELLVEDQVVGQGATPAASAGTGASTIWLMAAVVLAPASSGAPTVPGTPSGVTATAGDASASVAWTAPGDGGSPITSYTVTPYTGGTAQQPTTVTGNPPATSATVTGLTNGTSYTFTVSATNAVGAGPASSPSNAVTPNAAPQGQWGPLQTWPIVAVHSVLMHNGKMLQWDGWQTPEPTDIYDPAARTFTTVNAPSSNFCAGNVQLPDGRIMTVGGWGAQTTGQTGIVDTNIFDPATQTWTRVANMHLPRWYPDLVELPDGRYVAISGNSTDSNTWADTPEVYDPKANTWTLLSNVSTPQVHEEEYPFSYLAPNGKVFTIGPSEDQSFFLDVGNQTWTPVGSSGVVNGSSVMYRPGKILYSGGAASVTTTTPATAGSAVIDLTAATPTWQPAAPMNNARVYHTLTMLADGRVLAVGGEPTSNQDNVTTGVLPAEIWDPATGKWTAGPAMAAARNYHSTAVLMPDGTVLVAGGGHEENSSDPGQFSAQVYSPSYLFNGPRPAIASAPASSTYGASMNISTPDAASISAVNLVSLGADTHQMDMDQHFVPLSFTAGSGSLSVQAPASAALAPPGYYMLFIVNKLGVPSVAAIVRMDPAAPTLPAAPSGVIASAGNGSASVTWTAPSDGGSPITSYTVTPYVAGVAQQATTISGNPPATSATITGLTNGTSYTFTVSATNAVGTGPASAPSNAVTPSGGSGTVSFVQQVSGHGHGGTLGVTPGSEVVAGDRMVVEVGVWNSSHATASGVTDSAGNVYTELTHFAASDGTEMSVWSAPVTAGGGTKPVITAKTTSSADIGIAATEYSGLSAASGSAVLDVQAHATGTTSAARTVSSGATAATTADGELAIGFYADSGFTDVLTPGTGWTGRVNLSPAPDMELMVEDQPASLAATPAASAGTGAGTVWLMATLVLKHS
ncbi:MAG TPA: fibronectin type III domain-containing protein [Streptosporangiaceae bacterium]|nr:fibronectin type III domain-containing protein [Streptosporangiaceae bacterium]